MEKVTVCNSKRGLNHACLYVQQLMHDIYNDKLLWPSPTSTRRELYQLM